MTWLLSWSLYWLGDAVSRAMIGPLGCLYPVYNKLMIASYKVQGDGKGPWR